MIIHQKLPRLNICCRCIDLRTGCILLGILELFGAIAGWLRFIEYTLEAIEGQKIDENVPAGDH